MEDPHLNQCALWLYASAAILAADARDVGIDAQRIGLLEYDQSESAFAGALLTAEKLLWHLKNDEEAVRELDGELDVTRRNIDERIRRILEHPFDVPRLERAMVGFLVLEDLYGYVTVHA